MIRLKTKTKGYNETNKNKQTKENRLAYNHVVCSLADNFNNWVVRQPIKGIYDNYNLANNGAVYKLGV